MAVVIRMKRTGRRNRPCFRISVADSRSPRDGRTLDNLGLYDPVSKNTEAQITLDVERARHWLNAGALPSETVRSIFKRQGVYEGEHAPRATPKKTERPRRSRKATATSKRRKEAKDGRATRKAARQAERVGAKRAAAKAAKAAAASEGSEG